MSTMVPLYWAEPGGLGNIVPPRLPTGSSVGENSCSRHRIPTMARSSSVKARIVAIGNSQGIRIPKPLLQHAGLGGDVDLDAEHPRIVIAAARLARAGLGGGRRTTPRTRRGRSARNTDARLRIQGVGVAVSPNPPRLPVAATSCSSSSTPYAAARFDSLALPRGLHQTN